MVAASDDHTNIDPNDPGVEVAPSNPFEGMPCRECGQVALRLEFRPVIQAKPLGTHSLSGNQLKVSAHKIDRWPWCACMACGAAKPGKQ